jgi:hypothetical protein
MALTLLHLASVRELRGAAFAVSVCRVTAGPFLSVVVVAGQAAAQGPRERPAVLTRSPTSGGGAATLVVVVAIGRSGRANRSAAGVGLQEGKDVGRGK